MPSRRPSLGLILPSTISPTNPRNSASLLTTLTSPTGETPSTMIGRAGADTEATSPRPTDPPRPGSTLLLDTLISPTFEYRLSLPFQPSAPAPWRWKCHKCKYTYRLSTTRRCLVDGHYFCYQPSPRHPSPPASSTSDVSSPVVAAARPRSRRNAKLKKKKPSSCSSSFDYIGWQAWYEWRQAIFGSRTSPARSPRTRSAWEHGRRNCWENCSYPSECRHSMHEHRKSSKENSTEKNQTKGEKEEEKEMEPGEDEANEMEHGEDEENEIKAQEAEENEDTSRMYDDVGIEMSKIKALEEHKKKINSDEYDPEVEGIFLYAATVTEDCEASATEDREEPSS